MDRINWNAPLETDEETPRAVIRVGPLDENGLRAVTLSDHSGGFYNNAGIGGWACANLRNAWTVATAAERMETLVRKLADSGYDRITDLTDEAREIVKLLPAPPVDPLLIEARQIVTEIDEGLEEETLAGLYDQGSFVRIALAGLKRGQELAHADYEVCGGVSYSRGTYPTYQRRSEAAGIEPGK